MALINFKNLPNTTTPLTAENLNNNFKELQQKVLWENSDLTVPFEEQTINLSSSDYDGLTIIYRGYRGNNHFELSTSSMKGSNIFLSYVQNDSTNNVPKILVSQRIVLYSSDTQLNATKAYYYTSETGLINEENGYCVPHKIIGFKLG